MAAPRPPRTTPRRSVRGRGRGSASGGVCAVTGDRGRWVSGSLNSRLAWSPGATRPLDPPPQPRRGPGRPSRDRQEWAALYARQRLEATAKASGRPLEKLSSDPQHRLERRELAQQQLAKREQERADAILRRLPQYKNLPRGYEIDPKYARPSPQDQFNRDLERIRAEREQDRDFGPSR